MNQYTFPFILILTFLSFFREEGFAASQKDLNPVVKDTTVKDNLVIVDPIGDISTTIPVTQNREANVYNWQERHQKILSLNKERLPKIVFIGNSILHYWGGEPTAPFIRGNDSWNEYFKPKDVRNMGFGWDRIENALWRVHNGELDGYTASHVVVLIGTNNLSINTDDEIVLGLKFLLESIKRHQPKAKIIVMGLLPRRNHESRISILNKRVSTVADTLNLTYADSDNLLLAADGKINERLFSDGVHPNAEGYGLLAPFINSYLVK